MTPPIPPYVEEVYEFLKKEVTWLHARWIIFDQLYSKGELRLELLNEAGSSFFHMLQLMMYDDMQLSLARLTDPAPLKASLLQLQKRLDSHGNAKLAATAKPVLNNLLKSVEAIRKNRDNLIAHSSLDQATNPHAEKLPDVYYQDVVECLRLVREYMNLIELHHYDGEQGYEHFVWQDDGDNLVTVLKWGIRHRETLKTKGFFEEKRDKWSDA
jgi:hypothetical protein